MSKREKKIGVKICVPPFDTELQWRDLIAFPWTSKVSFLNFIILQHEHFSMRMLKQSLTCTNPYTMHVIPLFGKKII